MVQIIKENRRPSFGEKLNVGIGRGLEFGSQIMKQKQSEQRMHQENQAFQQLTGMDISGIQDPNMRQEAFSTAMKERLQGQKLRGQEESSQQGYNTIKDAFGKQFADVWLASDPGARTELVRNGLETIGREGSAEDIFNRANQIREQTEASKPNIKTIDYDKGLTPKERVKRQEDRYGKNLPFYQESQKKLSALDMSQEELGILEELSPQIGSLQKLNINPMSGELIFPGLASPEVQRFVKTVNDFTTRAKDSYGTRVTNFDLNQFMKRLPTLANSEEGRRQIIEQMKLIDQMNIAKERSLQEVIEEHGGIRNIDYDRAEQMADRISKPKISELKKDLKKIGVDQDKSYRTVINEKKKKAPPGYLLMEHDGQFGYVPEKEVKQAEKDGAKVL